MKVLLDSAIAIEGDDGKALGAGDFFQIFVGLAPLPSSFDWFIEDNEAGMLSAALAEHLCNKKSWRQSRDQVMKAYPVNKPSRRERFAEVMAGLRDYTAEELDGELLDLYETNRSLTGSVLLGVDSFLEDLRNRALIINNKNSL